MHIKCVPGIYGHSFSSSDAYKHQNMVCLPLIGQCTNISQKDMFPISNITIYRYRNTCNQAVQDSSKVQATWY